MGTNSINEQTTKKNDYPDHIQEIARIIKQTGGVNDLFCELADPQIQFLAENLQISPNAVVLYAALVNLYTGQNISLAQLADYVKLSPIVLRTFVEEFEELEKKELVQIFRGNVIPFASRKMITLVLP
jgi:hypothetical protein